MFAFVYRQNIELCLNLCFTMIVIIQLREQVVRHVYILHTTQVRINFLYLCRLLLEPSLQYDKSLTFVGSLHVIIIIFIVVILVFAFMCDSHFNK